jgi:hypothetical protein
VIRLASVLLSATAAGLVGCQRSPAGPEEPRIALSLHGDGVVYVAVGASPADPFQVIAKDAATGLPVQGRQIQWQVVQGSVTLTQTVSSTDFYGVASTSVSPAQAGESRVRATTQRLEGSAPVLEIRVVPPPVISGVTPAVVSPGDLITITGSGFSATAAHNAVYFDGVRGTVQSASATELRVTVPQCLPARNVAVVAGLGGALSAPAQLTTTSSTATTIALLPGEVRTFEGADLACVRLPPDQNNALYLLSPHNATASFAPPFRFELRALSPTAPAVAVPMTTVQAPFSFAEQWEALLRERERELGGPAERDAVSWQTVVAAPSVGEQREFNVLNSSNGFDRITATARLVTERAVLFVDGAAQDAFSAADLAYFGQLFDDPIHATTVGTFGEPSDIDGNGRIFILFTPRVNALTPRNESSFITGFFYGCDLVGRTRCSGSNDAEIFYSLVPDPSGQWSSARTHSLVRDAVPPVLAHEFQHMIHFARRGFSADVLWLSEGLAHTAEELVAAALASTNPTLAASFGRGNLQRAQRYLTAPHGSGLIEPIGSGTLEMRGAAWLFVKHLRGHYGGADLLRNLTGSTRNGVANVTHETAQPWTRLLADFGVALWADGAPQLQAPLDDRYRFTDFDLRTALAVLPGGYPLQPTAVSWGDFAVAGAIAPASHAYFLLAAPQGGSVPPLNFVLSRTHGAPIGADAGVGFSVLRVR